MDNTNNLVYEETFKVYTWDVDKADRLKISAMYNFCQDIAGNHASKMGIGRDYMINHGLVWILSRMSAVLVSRPPRNSKLVLRTWSRGAERIFAMRDYELVDEADKVVGLGRAAWIIAELQSLRPRRPETSLESMPAYSKAALEDGAVAIAQLEDINTKHDLRTERAVSYSDVDYNGHMNNASYAEWTQDLFFVDELSSADRLRLDIQYAAEIKPSQSAVLYKKAIDSMPGWNKTYAVEGHITNGTCSFRARLSL